MINDITISPNTEILTALKKMDEIGRKLLLVIEDDKFCGVLSIGDIQRAIIKQKKLQDPVSEILRKIITVSHVSESYEEIKKKMIEKRTECMPVLDDENKLVKVIFWEDIIEDTKPNITKNFNLPIVIMAGGKGTRLRPITHVIPKPLIPIGEKTILEIIMDSFIDFGSDNFYLSVNYKADMIDFYLKGVENRNYNVSYFQEEKPLGTAGSLHLLKDKIKDTFFVTNCDILVDQDYSEVLDYHRTNNNELTIVAALKHYSIPYGTIETKEESLLKAITEKPEITYKINTGLYILEPSLLNEIPENKFFHITHLIEKLQTENRRVGIFPVSEKSWTDIGEWPEYLKLIKVF